MNQMVNLAVDLHAPQFDAQALAQALTSIEALGYAVERDVRSERLAAWIDQQFSGTWGAESHAGYNVVVSRGGDFAGFATYDAQGLRFSWLRGAGSQAGTGIFGPFGVHPEHRGSGIGPHLLVAALASLRERAYERALIPAVGEEKLVEYYTKHSGAEVIERFDKARWQQRRFRTVVFASGNGTNFQSVIDAVQQNRLPLDLAALITNRGDAFALERARRAGIARAVLPWDRKAQSREQYDAALIELVRREQPELILLLGWMHLLPPAFFDEFEHAINIHPAYLPFDQSCDEVTFPDGTVTPAFRGARAVADALALECKWVGASSHLVTLDADRGPVLTRKPLRVQGEIDAVMAALHPFEHRVLASGIMRWVYEQ